MAAQSTMMLALGTAAPEFTLPDTVSGETIALENVQSAVATVVMFICNHCPFVKHVNPELVRLANDYAAQDVAFVAINSNDAETYPEDAPERMKEIAEERSYPFPYLYDEDQSVARAYAAACTPDIFVFDGDMNLAYRGQLDGARPGNDVPLTGNDVPLTGEDVRAALDALIAGEAVSEEQRPSIGCSIKWKEL